MSNSKQLARHGAKAAPLNEDHQLILDCLSVASNLAAGHAIFKAAPPGDDKLVEQLAYRHFNAARRTLEQVTSTKPKTVSGLIAQAHLLPVVLDDDFMDQSGCIEESTERFIRSFVANVSSHLKQLTPEHPTASQSPKAPSEQ